jgi:hypothetical protein
MMVPPPDQTPRTDRATAPGADTTAHAESGERLPDSRPVPPSGDLGAALAEAVEQYRISSNVTHLHLRLAALATDATPEALIVAVEPFRDIPEVAGPIYERIVAAQPANARALVILANAYWLAGRGPDVVGELAARARAADPSNRGAWHLWALSEPSPRRRVERWSKVCQTFLDDDLARANLADNAASLAGAEHDPAALQLALETYGALRDRATHPLQQSALDQAIATLRTWKV